jgi:hypothetical protein
MEYKVDDWVVRLNNAHLGIRVGQVCQIYEIIDTNSLSSFQLRLQGQNDPTGSHAIKNLRRALPEEIPYIPSSKPENYKYLTKLFKKLKIK